MIKRRLIRHTCSSDERGYALVALLVVMSLMALLALAAAPQVRQQTQRDPEKEAIFRAEQTAAAIRLYYQYRGNQGVNSFPTSIVQFLECIPPVTTNLHIPRSEPTPD